MSEIIETYLKNLQNKPRFEKYKSFLWADYIELLCLANNDGELSHNDIIDRLLERERDLFEGNYDDLKEMEDLENEDNDSPTQRSEIPIRWENYLSSWFNVLQYRQVLHKESYPFDISDKVIKRKEDVSAEPHKLYLYLLLCSNLYLFDNTTRLTLTSSFEMVSFNAFKNILPQQAEVHLFGSNKLNNKGKFRQGSLWKKINALSLEINEVLDPRLNENNYPNNNTGDGGLDLVGWLPTGDRLPSSVIHFAQCACTEEWVSKQDSSSHNTWQGRILFRNHINNTIFIPFCFRSADGAWFKIEDIRLSFLVDRKRLLHYYLQKENISFNNLPAYQIVEEIISAREDVV